MFAYVLSRSWGVAPEKWTFFSCGGNMVAKLKVEEIEGRVPPVVWSAVQFDSTQGNSPVVRNNSKF